MATYTLTLPFKFGEEVVIGRDGTLTGNVVEYCLREGDIQVKVVYIDAGRIYTEWVPQYLLKEKKP